MDEEGTKRRRKRRRMVPEEEEEDDGKEAEVYISHHYHTDQDPHLMSHSCSQIFLGAV